MRTLAESSLYICEHCGQEIHNHQKHSMLARGEWRAGGKGDGRTADFHISSLYSPAGWFSWGDAARQFEQAQKNSSLLQVFVNTVLGETWTMLGEAPDWKVHYDRREDLKTGIVPRAGLFLTAGPGPSITGCSKAIRPVRRCGKSSPDS